ncbi:MAG: alpha/beta fold hydrolase [Dermatophilaceae bacterium]
MIQTSAGTFAVYTHGSGEPVVLLHANPGDHHDYDQVVPRLVDAGYQVHAVDWPGFGGSVAAGPMSAVTYAEVLPEVLAALGTEPAVVVGNSVGGFAAVLTAARRPQLVRALVLVNPGGFTPQWLGSSAACQLIGRPRLAGVFLRLLPLIYLRTRSDAVRATRHRASRLRFAADSRRVFGELWRSFADPRHDAREAARTVQAPTLLVWGTRDLILPWLVDGRRAAAALPHAHVIRMPCGHQAFIERPSEFGSAVGDFLTGLRE